jgi:Mg/Co/Ni transporter MgtE
MVSAPSRELKTCTLATCSAWAAELCVAILREVMSEGLCYCFEDDDVEQAAQVMAQHQMRRLPVVNRNKRLVGVSQADTTDVQTR